ncbi:MAG: hypothetical protein VYB65_05160, partial [Myxococcota bacterium]|nr:hypothetical protein [Myxococcota bacterium]
MMRRASLALLGLVMGCGQLPALPDEAAERLPTELEFNGLTLAVGFEGAGATVQPDAILAGTAVEAMFTVRAQDGLPLAGALIQFGVKTERWERVLDFPLGTSCTTDAQGECSTVLRSEGRAGAVQFEARVAGLESQWINLTVLPEAEQAQVLVEIEGLGSFDWQTGQGLDPLENDATRLVLDKNQTAGRTLSVRLLDTFGNALDGVPVQLEVLRPGAPPSGGADAGPSLDAGASVPDGSVAPDASPGDSGARADLGGALDAGSERDAGDAGAVRDVGDGDGGLNKPLSLAPDESPALLAAAGAEGCAGELLRGTEATANAAADGYTRFCVFPGELLGDFVVTIKPGALFLVGEKDRMSLRGETRAGAPSRVVYVDRGQTPEGDVPRLGCRPGSLSAVATFRAENDEGPVPNVRVRLEAEGGLDGLTSALEVSDAEGLVQVQAICPAQSLAGGRILADLAAVPGDEPASVAVQVRTDNVDEVTIVEHGAWPQTLRSGGDPLTLRLQAFNAAGAPVLRAGLRPDDNAPDNREPLTFAVTIASQGHAGRILLDDGNGAFTVPLVEQSLVVDQDLGSADFRFKVQSPATFDNPIVFRVIEPGSQVSAQRVLHVAPGAPTHISVSPSGVVSAELLGAAGSFAFSVWDGDPAQGANRVPDVPINVAVPRSFVFLRGSNLTNIAGRTGNDGRFVVDVLQAQPIGDHTLEGSITVGEAQPSAPVTVRVGAGEVASALEVRLDGEALPVITPEGGEALPTLTLRGGTSLAQTLTFRIVNRFGGGMPELGLTYSLEQGVEANCASFDEPNPTNTDGEITYGPGNQTLTAGGEVTDCVYRFAHGNTAAVQRLRVRQVPGLPQRATLTLTLRDGENDASAVRLRNSMDPPNEWSDETSREVVLRAFDANNLAPAGLRMWLTVDNCYLQTRAAELDEQGRAV